MIPNQDIESATVEPVKLCINCRYCDKSKDATTQNQAFKKLYWLCQQTASVDVRDGSVSMREVFDARLYSGKCGQDGKLYEPIIEGETL